MASIENTSTTTSCRRGFIRMLYLVNQNWMSMESLNSPIAKSTKKGAISAYDTAHGTFFFFFKINGRLSPDSCQPKIHSSVIRGPHHRSSMAVLLNSSMGLSFSRPSMLSVCTATYKPFYLFIF